MKFKNYIYLIKLFATVNNLNVKKSFKRCLSKTFFESDADYRPFKNKKYIFTFQLMTLAKSFIKTNVIFKFHEFL